MADQSGEWLSVVVNNGFHLLKQFTEGMSLPRWLAPLSMVGVLSTLDKLLPSMQKGSFLAGLGSYLLIGILIVNLLALSLFLYLPGKLVTSTTPAVAQSGRTLLKLLLMGCLVVVKNVVIHSLKLAFDLTVLLIAALTYPPREASQIAAHC